jgi:hypothetical protein
MIELYDSKINGLFVNDWSVFSGNCGQFSAGKYKYSMILLQRLVMIVLFSVFVMSCGDISTNTTPVVNNKVTAGSTFTFIRYSTDSLNMIIPGLEDTTVSTVLQTDGTLGKQTGIMIVANTSAGISSTEYYKYQTNDNFSLLEYSQWTGELVWKTLPFGFGNKLISVSADSTLSKGITTVIRDSTFFAYVGESSLLVDGETILTKIVQRSDRAVRTKNNVVVMNTRADNTYYYYAPSLGFIIKMTTPYHSDSMGNYEYGSLQRLDYYKLK